MGSEMCIRDRELTKQIIEEAKKSVRVLTDDEVLQIVRGSSH